MSTQQMLYILQKPTNSTKLNSASSVSKAALCLYQQLFNTLAVRELHCISTTHFLGYSYCIHYISCTPLFCVHFMLTSQYMYILELEGGGVVPSGRNHCVTTFDLPKAGSGAPPICRPTPQLWKYTAYGQGRSSSEWHTFMQNRQILLVYMQGM